MDASASPDAAGKSDPSSDVPNIDSPGLVPEQGEGGTAQPAAKPPMTALVIAEPRIEGVAHGAGMNTESLFARLRMPQVSRLAATVLLAACVGAIAGSLATFAASRAFAPSPPADTHLAETHVLQDSIARLHSELAGVRAGADAKVKAANAQVAKLNERIERAEKAARAHVAALAAPATAPAAPSPVAPMPHAAPPSNTASITGSIPESRNMPGAKDMSRPPIIAGWVLRNVYDGTAYIQSREGMIEVAVGDRLPDGGRVEAIRRENGRWVVLTTRGMVVMR